MGIETALIGGAVVGGAASLLGAKKQASAAESAAQTQAESSRASLEVQKEMFDKQVALNKPWQEAGLKALDAYAKNPAFKFTYDNFTADPGYKFRMEEGVKALDMSAASRGKLLSGAQDKAIQQYGQGMASQEYGNAYNRALDRYTTEQNRQLNVANIGRGAAGQTQQAIQNYASGAGNAYTAMGSAAAQGALNQANAYTQGIQGISTSINQGLGNYMLYNMMK